MKLSTKADWLKLQLCGEGGMLQAQLQCELSLAYKKLFSALLSVRPKSEKIKSFWNEWT